MFNIKSILETAFRKLHDQVSLKWNEWVVVYMNDLGFTGVGFGAVALFFFIRRGLGGADSTFFGITNWTYFCVFFTLFVFKNLQTIEKIWKKEWLKMFPKGLVIPYINKTIK